MCIRLADFLRISLSLGSRPTIPLGEELDLARNYLELERVRFSDRLRVEIDIEPGCENCAVPTLLLQPLVENAVKHGIAGLVEGGTIRLEARRDAHGAIITVTNPFDAAAPPPERLGVGLAQVRRRLEVRYGAAARLDTGTASGVYRVVVRMRAFNRWLAGRWRDGWRGSGDGNCGSRADPGRDEAQSLVSRLPSDIDSWSTSPIPEKEIADGRDRETSPCLA
jgi:hypothetical protein